MGRILLFTVLIIISISQVISIKCYACDSLENSACGDPINVNKIDVQDCDSGDKSTKCGKAILHGNGTSGTLRGCANKQMNCDSLVVPDGYKMEHCSFCDSDLCNTSVTLSGGLLSLFPVIISIFVINKF
uniref:13.7 kDa midgut protein n=1 Tax=Phlebotomus papatasi TaxID=29031 RepID=A8CAE6_PHLPP|nr:13.7 kDa midgut protein [Phlebotomus papatasi]